MLAKHGRSDIAPNAGATYGHLKPYRHTQAADLRSRSPISPRRPCPKRHRYVASKPASDFHSNTGKIPPSDQDTRGLVRTRLCALKAELGALITPHCGLACEGMPNFANGLGELGIVGEMPQGELVIRCRMRWGGRRWLANYG
jgi:hypothetical protein